MTNILIVEARFYENYADELVNNAIKVLEENSVTYQRLSVPGCFEIPAAISLGFKTGRYDGYIALGCVIRGETTHYDYVCMQSAQGLNNLAIEHDIAIGYGIITAENHKQVEHRVNCDGKDVGGRSAKACLEMINLKKQLGLS